jgi:hypothetical protein
MSLPIKSTIDTLLDNNYQEYCFEPRYSSQYKSCDRFFQKRVRTLEGKTQYVINAYIYNFSKYNFFYGQVQTSFEMDFYDNHNRNIRISLSLHDFDSIQDFEEYVKDLFIRNNFVNDIHND